MPPRSNKYLRDILDAALLIRRFTEGMTLADYESDIFVRSAVERQLTILCEAMAQLFASDETLAEQISDHESIVGMRIVLVHRYGDLDNRRVWSTVTLSLPVLIQEVSSLLDQC